MPLKKKIATGVIGAAFALYAVTTGGIVVSQADHFGGQKDIKLTSGLDSDIWLAPNNTILSIPFVFHYNKAASPFGLRLQIWDRSKQYQSVEITEAITAYVNIGMFKLP